ncbi:MULTISPECIES: GntR family transcriptional regulator [Anaerotruncus]|uniref:GntR family transcriptional regulator n=1 Tax=Anaerotruncus TaxID=244127 RepID=UPI000E50CFDC|nr:MULTISPECIES: GntR family transcriptional regulator [Anaerotruncus]RGX55640.1 GntR family transcriptional regulator [Anaerotruncus sp. AF02-27]
MAIETIKKVPLHEVVYEKLKTSILEGDFRPGERLNQSLLADKLGVSRMPVRDALRILENDALIENQMDKGYVVANFSRQKMDDILFVRSILEPKAVLYSRGHLSDEDISQMGDILAQAWTELKAGNWKSLHRLNTDFHFLIYNAAGSPLLLELIEKLWHSFPKYLLHEQYDANLHSLHGHENILRFIKSGNFEAAATEMEHHISQH